MPSILYKLSHSTLKTTYRYYLYFSNEKIETNVTELHCESPYSKFYLLNTIKKHLSVLELK